MSNKVLQLIALIVCDINGLMRLLLLIYYLLLVDLVAFVHHAVGSHHARSPDLRDSTRVAVSFVVLPVGHGC